LEGKQRLLCDRKLCEGIHCCDKKLNELNYHPAEVDSKKEKKRENREEKEEKEGFCGEKRRKKDFKEEREVEEPKTPNIRQTRKCQEKLRKERESTAPNSTLAQGGLNDMDSFVSFLFNFCCKGKTLEKIFSRCDTQ